MGKEKLTVGTRRRRLKGNARSLCAANMEILPTFAQGRITWGSKPPMQPTAKEKITEVDKETTTVADGKKTTPPAN